MLSRPSFKDKKESLEEKSFLIGNTSISSGKSLSRISLGSGEIIRNENEI